MLWSLIVQWSLCSPIWIRSNRRVNFSQFSCVFSWHQSGVLRKVFPRSWKSVPCPKTPHRMPRNLFKVLCSVRSVTVTSWVFVQDAWSPSLTSPGRFHNFQWLCAKPTGDHSKGFLAGLDGVMTSMVQHEYWKPLQVLLWTFSLHTHHQYTAIFLFASEANKRPFASIFSVVLEAVGIKSSVGQEYLIVLQLQSWYDNSLWTSSHQGVCRNSGALITPAVAWAASIACVVFTARPCAVFPASKPRVRMYRLLYSHALIST